MKKNDEFSRKSTPFLKSACLALCLVSFGGTAAYAESSYATHTMLTVQMNGKSIKDVFSYIEKNSEFIFIYHGSNINLNRKVNVDVTNRSVDKILQQMFDGTDIDGNFSLADVSENAVISISYIGYQTQDIPVKATINVVLKEDSEALNEVVVIGYGTQKKVDLSGAVATVSTKVLENRPVLTVGQALQGAVANMTVSIGSGQATDSPSFNIRGTTSINGGDPLVVIDGVVSTAEELNRMNPSDIGSISVLKDAASAAIYGSRAAFGVILVTTKTAGQEKLTVNYSILLCAS